MPDVIWQGPEHGDGETLAAAFRRLTGRDFDPRRCLWEEWCGDRTVYHWRDGLEVAVGEGGHCTISRSVGFSVCSAHRVPEPGCPLCDVRWEGGGGGAG